MKSEGYTTWKNIEEAIKRCIQVLIDMLGNMLGSYMEGTPCSDEMMMLMSYGALSFQRFLIDTRDSLREWGDDGHPVSNCILSKDSNCIDCRNHRESSGITSLQSSCS